MKLSRNKAEVLSITNYEGYEESLSRLHLSLFVAPQVSETKEYHSVSKNLNNQ